MSGGGWTWGWGATQACHAGVQEERPSQTGRAGLDILQHSTTQACVGNAGRQQRDLHRVHRLPSAAQGVAGTASPSGPGSPSPPSTGPATPRPGTRPDPNKYMPHLEFTDYVGEQDLREGSPDEFDGHLAPGIGVLEQPCVARAALACARGNPKFEQRGWMGEEVCYHMPGPHLGVSAACSCPPRKSRLWRTWTCCPRWCPWTRRGSQVCWNHTP